MKSEITIGEKYGPAMEITDQAEADRYFEECVQHCMSHGATRARAEEIERINLGYYAGYYSHETRERVERLFRCSHPVFGQAAKHKPTVEECVAAGRAAAKRLNEESFSHAPARLTRPPSSGERRNESAGAHHSMKYEKPNPLDRLQEYLKNRALVARSAGHTSAALDYEQQLGAFTILRQHAETIATKPRQRHGGVRLKNAEADALLASLQHHNE